jgi:5-methylcytosine-specific restriction enzyme A
MGIKRQPYEIWQLTRKMIWERDGKRCRHCQTPVSLNACHIDHIRSGRQGSNRKENLRTLCRRCHVLRADSRHRGMIAAALRDGIIPPNWRELLWEDD